MESLSYKDFVAKLQGSSATSVTQNWDVAVTYEASKINALLAAEQSKPDSRLPSKVKIPIPGQKSPWGTYTQYYELELGPPLIQFQAAGIPHCSLTMLVVSFKGWSEADDDGKKSPVTDYGSGAYRCVLSDIPLGAVSGSTESSSQPENTMVFDDSSVSEHIIVAFPNKSNGLHLEPTPGHSAPTEISSQTAFEIELKKFFDKVPKLAYTLAIINNKAPQVDKFKVLDLVPQSFRIVCAASANRSFLSLLIRTKAAAPSTTGNTKNLQEAWSGLWATLKSDPVPFDETASIIINKSFFVNQYLMRATDQKDSKGYTAMRVIPLENGSGFKLEFDWQTIKKDGAKESGSLVVTGSNNGESVKIEDRTIDPNQGGQKLNIAFGQANGTDRPATVHVQWSYKDYIPWKDHTHDVGTEGGRNRNRKGVVIATQTLDKTVEIANDLNDESFSVKLGITEKDWHLKTEAKGTSTSDKITSILGNIFGIEYSSEHVPNLAKILAQTYIQFDFDFGALRFFLTTNILLPGRKVIDVNLHDGLRIPNDVVIVGKVVKEAA